MPLSHSIHTKVGARVAACGIAVLLCGCVATQPQAAATPDTEKRCRMTRNMQSPGPQTQAQTAPRCPESPDAGKLPASALPPIMGY